MKSFFTFCFSLVLLCSPVLAKETTLTTGSSSKKASTSSSFSDSLICLATTIYWESANQPVRGQLAVANVVINRVHSKRFPSTICGVVRQKYQFSWFKGGPMKDYIPKNDKRFNKALIYAKYIMFSRQVLKKKGNIGGALYFHADYVYPNWTTVKKVEQIGDHIFYRSI